MQVALLGGSAGSFASWRSRNVAAARCEGRKDGVEMPNRIGFAADHHAVAALKPPDAAAGPDVDIVDAFGAQLLGPADVVDVIGVATIDEDVTAVEMGQKIGNGLVNRADRHHQPDRARLRQLAGKLVQGSSANGLLL